jgi:hypothetical protein
MGRILAADLLQRASVRLRRFFRSAKLRGVEREELIVGAAEATEGTWKVEQGKPSPADTTTWRDDVEDLTYSNPFGQNLERVWFEGKVAFATELGELDVDPAAVKVAQEYQIVYDAELDERGKPVREPERVEGQFNIYDSVPGMEKYSPLWQFNYVVVPRSYEPNSLRSEADCLNSGFPIHQSTVIEN